MGHSWTNKRFVVDGMTFDAAIDWCRELHPYSNDIPEGSTPVELYNLTENWDIYMIYPEEVTDENIIKGIKEWVSQSRPSYIDE